MPVVEVAEATYRALVLAARMTRTTPGAIIDKLVAETDGPPGSEPERTPLTTQVRVYALYNGIRIQGSFDPLTRTIEIVSGTLTGSRHKSPSSAARAVIAHVSPTVNTNRNGWTFWRLDDGTGAPLQTIRYGDGRSAIGGEAK